MKKWIALIALLVIVAPSVSIAVDKGLVWPQFRGPAGAGVAESQKPPVEVGPDKNVKWKIETPSGLSSPIAIDDKLVITAFDGGKLYTIAYRRPDGKEIWRAEAPFKQIEEYNKTEGSPAASTSATDGQHIVSYFGSCGLFCYDLNGKELWKLEMPTASTSFGFGSGVSPIIADGVVVLVRDEQTDPKIIAVDATTGKPKWEKKRDKATAYCTPVLWDAAGGKQVVVAGAHRMIAYDLASGDEVWTVVGMPSACCASPEAADGILFYAGWAPGDPDDKDFKMPSFDEILKAGDTDGDGILSKAEADQTDFKNFFDNQDTNKDGKLTREEWDANMKSMAAGKNRAFAIKAGGKGNVTDSHMLWQKTKGLPYVATGIVYGGQYVLIKDGGLVTAYDAKTGKEIYVQQRAAGTGSYYASPVAANGMIYFTSLADGAITVLKAGATAPEAVAKNPPLEERTSATPAIADDTLYVRTAGHMYAFSDRK